MRFFVMLFFLGFNIHAKAQNNITIKYFGVTFHPFGDTYAYLQPYRLDKNAMFVLNFGTFIGYEHFVVQDYISLKITQGLFTDCSAGKAGFTHFGIKSLILQRPKHAFSFSIGPMWFYRESWTRFPEYNSSGVFKLSKDGKVQSKFFWYGGEIEYDCYISNKLKGSITFTPGIPFVMSFAFGLKYWINQNVKAIPLKF